MKNWPCAFVLVSCVLSVAIPPAQAESLYNEGSFRAFAADKKAWRKGDPITVQVYEQSSASTSTDTNSDRSNSLSLGLSSAAGRQRGGSLAQAGSFNGGGTTQRTNKLLATLTVIVSEVLPNGDLVVGGHQDLTVNNEHHKVDLQGRVRPLDISSDNVVLSTRLADAHIDYVGEGDLSDRQKRAWWRSALDWLGL